MKKTKEEIWGGAESRAFYRAVCDRLTRATGRERKQVRQELANHLQDHTEALVERGLAPEAAETRAVAEMGNPIQIAWDLNKSFSRFWLIFKRVVMVLLCVVFVLCFGRDVWGVFGDNMLARLPSGADLSQLPGQALAYADLEFNLEQSRPLNLNMKSDSTVVRLEQIAVGSFTDGSDKKGYCVCFSASIYSKNPFDPCRANLRLYLADDPDGLLLLCPISSKAVGGRGDGMCFAYEVDYGTEVLTVAWERYGQDCQVQVPLSWEGVA